MQEALFYVGIVCAALGGVGLLASVGMFFGFHIPLLLKDYNGSLEQKQIEEIRKKNSGEARNKGKINAYAALEKEAREQTARTVEEYVDDVETSALVVSAEGGGTAVLKSSAKSVNPNFLIEKNIVFVSTDAVL